MVCVYAGMLVWEVTASGAPGWLRYVSAPYLFCPWVVEVCLCSLFILLSTSPVYTPWFLVCNRFLYKPFSKKKGVFVGLKESTSLWVEIPVGIRLPTAGSLQTPQKWDPQWKVLLLLLLYPHLSKFSGFQTHVLASPNIKDKK